MFLKTRYILGGLLFLLWGSLSCYQQNRSDYPVRAVPFTQVKINDDFWAQRIDTNRTVTIPFAMQQNEVTGRVDNFRIAGKLKQGDYRGERYNDTDVYKVMEGAAYTLATSPDPELAKRLDELIALIAAAQEEDGYLFTPRTASPGKLVPGIGEERWSNLAVSHELYNAGHMFEAASAHFSATGKRNFLEVALKKADLLVKTFGRDRIRNFPGHQEVEIGLIKLYRITGKQEYLELAEFFLAQRGKDLNLKRYPPDSRFAIYNDPVQIQAHKPVLAQREAVGHAVRAVYMYSAMTDIAALTGKKEYAAAVDRLWENVVYKKMALIGGLGAFHDRERFGADYELPNLTSYNETCASIGNVFWNHRMFLLHQDSRYIDVMERSLYNAVIAGVSLMGNTFFYPNPLASDGKYRFNKGSAGRQPWFGVACCPGNIARFLPSIPGYIYAAAKDIIYINLFIGSQAEISLAEHKVAIRQTTDYPWDGNVSLEMVAAPGLSFCLKLRMPGWAGNHPVPGDLYSYEDEQQHPPVIAVNGIEQKLELEQGYAAINRVWQTGDKLELLLPMPVRRVLSHPAVTENQEKVAFERGPLVYCAEWPDNPGRVLDRVVADNTVFKPVWRPELLGGIMVLESSGARRTTLIPYYAWAHRGAGEMAVWLNKGEN